MLLGKSDQIYLDRLADRVLKNQQSKTDTSDREFLLHLYDALWENMRSKENRLWTFLSVYGAAVGLLFAGGQASQVLGAELFALIVIMALTVWAVLIVLNANWWYARNQLMVTRIEKYFAEAVKGVVPEEYHDPDFRYDSLSKSSVLVLSLLLFLLYSRTLWLYHVPESIGSSMALFAIAALYFLFVCSIAYCLQQHESYIPQYYDAKRVLLKDANELDQQMRLKLFEDEIRVRTKHDVRLWLLFLLTLATGLFDFVLYRNGVPLLLWLWGVPLGSAILYQLGMAVVFYLQWRNYIYPLAAEDWKVAKELLKLKKEDDANQKLARLEKILHADQRKSRLIALALLGLSASIPVVYMVLTNQKIKDDFWSGGKSVSVIDLAQQIERTRADLQRIQDPHSELQKSSIEMQQKLLNKRLVPYLTSEEAIKKFITREEFDKRVSSHPQAKSEGGHR